jgi:multiple sugar transport system substrate-binding protein
LSEYLIDVIVIYSDETKELLLDLGQKGRFEITNKTTGNTKYESLFTTFTKVSYPGNFFNRWECLFAIDSTAGATWLGTGATSSDAASGGDKSKPDFETVVRPVPQVDVENPLMISQGPSICLFNKEDTQEVIASWIFAQYMLTDEVQLDYTKTEGYLPVTSRTNESQAFKDYLNDNNEYVVKREATKLVLNNIDNTFISPVFNGSSDVRDAGAYLVEGVCGNNKRYKTAEEIDTLYEKCIEKYGLQELIDATGGETIERKISKESIILLSTLGIIWILLGTYVINDKIIKKRRK